MKKIISLVIALSFLVISIPIMSNSAFALANDGIGIREYYIAEDTKVTEITKSNNWKSVNFANSKAETIVKEHFLNEELFSQSEKVISQAQTFYVPETLNEDKETLNQASTVSGTWSDSEGYLTIYTNAYKTGTDAKGYSIFTIEGKVDIHKKFSYKNQEELIIHHSAGAYFNSNNLQELGQQGYHWREYVNNTGSPLIDEERDIVNTLQAEYMDIYGVNYHFEFPEDEHRQGGAAGYTYHIERESSNWWVRGQYSIIVPDLANVQVCYYHNENFFGGNLSVGFSVGAAGISLNIGGSKTPYEARPLLIYG